MVVLSSSSHPPVTHGCVCICLVVGQLLETVTRVGVENESGASVAAQVGNIGTVVHSRVVCGAFLSWPSFCIRLQPSQQGVLACAGHGTYWQ
jgi:hypothetical protein